MMTRASADAVRIGVNRRAWWILLGVVAVSGAPLVAAEPACRIEVVTDRAEALYETGETARFVIQVKQGEEPVSAGTVSYAVDDFITENPTPNDFPRGELSLSGEPLMGHAAPSHIHEAFFERVLRHVQEHSEPVAR
ncbi:MAG: hypothetical protein ABIP48_17380 [Planctomycetota bacterium]